MPQLGCPCCLCDLQINDWEWPKMSHHIRFDVSKLKATILTSKCLQRCAMERIHQSNNLAIRADQYGFAIARKLQSGPVALSLLVQFECDKWSLVKRSQIVQFDALRIDAGRKNQALWIVGGHRSAGQMHHTLTGGRPQVPQSQRLIQRTGQK